jgi:AcrR family transcriptional regulator
MGATSELLAERSVLDLAVVDIARRAEASPATFYHYFKDVEEVVLALAERAAEEMPAVLEEIQGVWRGEDGLARARAVVDAFLQHWDAHHPVLQLRNVLADRGDRRFMRVRRETLSPVLDALAGRIDEARAEGRVSEAIHPWAAAAGMGSLLERLAAHQSELALRGVSRGDLRETCARILFQTVTGRSAP